ncbi:N-acetyl-gamma-glutamyl-phosphate reductase [Pelagibius sp. Alg239-R121]|uniref:N-acetyl-gamma-glutamyl-phosphate reductase n=1 Tax=Pelagibius sp. Alg239-R121 TaxID=2993448 RepID=UPI0024A6D78A|nr:N-acetyl-gamma-glutamyl-phosphate reductase [Pelagibius sp. Alg239-R121]
MGARVFIDGEAGTTGLQIRARLQERSSIELLSLDDSQRKDPVHRARLLNSADLVVLCLPDAAAREAVSLLENPDVRVIDASTAHRTDANWVFGFPELDAGQEERVSKARFVSNPGCYSTGAIALIQPLIESGLLPADSALTINGVSGYSGGGRSMIEAYEDEASPNFVTRTYHSYGLGLHHKHVPEIVVRSGLTQRPIFVPSVGRYRQGMLVQVPLQLGALPGKPSVAAVHSALTAHYAGQRFVSVAGLEEASAAQGMLDPEALNGTNDMRLYVFGDEDLEQAVLIAQLDNLGKGASGAAVQNLNIMLGLTADEGLAARAAA